MALPTIISKLRTCKLIPHHFHLPVLAHHHGHEIHDDYTPDYKEWSTHRRRNGRYKWFVLNKFCNIPSNLFICIISFLIKQR